METVTGTGIDTTVLTILGAAFGVMFATLTTLMVTSIRFQHRESIQTRELINQAREENRELIEQATGKLAAELSADFDEHKRVTERNHNRVIASLSDARERLARIEGHLGIGLHPSKDPETNGDNSEAS